MSGVWLMTRAIPRGKYSMGPGPPMSLQLGGAIVLVISLINTSCIVSPGARFWTAELAVPLDASPAPVDWLTTGPPFNDWPLRNGVLPLLLVLPTVPRG